MNEYDFFQSFFLYNSYLKHSFLLIYKQIPLASIDNCLNFLNIRKSFLENSSKI